MARKSNRKKLYDKLDDICREIVRTRADGLCEWCGKPGREMSHIIPKSLGIIYRWHLQNILWLCHYCHFHRWHKDPGAAMEWLKSKYPSRYEKLQSLNKKPVKWSDEDLLIIFLELEKIKELLAERRLS